MEPIAEKQRTRPSKTNNMSSWEAEINTHAAKVAALRNTIGHLNGIVGKFTRPGFAYALDPLRASPKEIREANHLMLS